MPKYCSITFTCLYCGNPFTRAPSQVALGCGHYCSRECLFESRRRRFERTCETCGKVYTAKKKDRTRFCSRPCYEASRKREEIICAGCGKSLIVSGTKAARGRKYCSQECSSKAMTINRAGDKHPMWKGGQSNKRGPNWNSQRRLAQQRDGDVCQVCHRKRRKGERKFAIHHIRPYRTFNGDYIAANDLKNLITVCSACHGKAEHKGLAVPVPLL